MTRLEVAETPDLEGQTVGKKCAGLDRLIQEHARFQTSALSPILAITTGMAPRRFFVEGLSHHVYHRGNNRCDIFKDAEDHRILTLLLRRATKKFHVALHAEVQMTTHMHLLLTPSAPLALPRMMQSVCRSYVRYFNDRYRRTGTLWEGRYQSCLIVSERYWYTCMRYIELNPVRASLVASPGEYQWSSYHANALGRIDRGLTPHPLYRALGATLSESRERWREICGDAVKDTDLAVIRQAVHKGWKLEDHGATREASGEDLIVAT